MCSTKKRARVVGPTSGPPRAARSSAAPTSGTYSNMPVLIVALGMTLIILAAEIDLSVGSQFVICSVAAGVFAKMGLPGPLAGAAACVLGALMGSLNGALVAWARIPSIVVTLATMVALRDGLRWVTQGAWVQDLPAGFRFGHFWGLIG